MNIDPGASSGGLPAYAGSVDHMRQGFRNLETEYVQQHPVKSIQNSQSPSQGKIAE